MGLRRDFQCITISGLARTLASSVVVPREVMGSHRKMRIKSLHAIGRSTFPSLRPSKCRSSLLCLLL